jgi:hypothetical protein
MLQDGDDHPPASLQELKYLIAKRQIVFPNSLALVARLMLERPEMIAFESAAAIARRCSVHKRPYTGFHSTLGFGHSPSSAQWYENIFARLPQITVKAVAWAQAVPRYWS